MTETDPLLAAVEALTKPVVDHVAQRTDSGKWVKTHAVEHPPLLQQMHDAVIPSGGNDGSSKVVAPSERSLLDDNALYEYLKIATQIRGWLRDMEGIPHRDDPVRDLQSWLSLTRALHDWDDSWYTRTLRGWAHHITGMLDKNRRDFTIPGACPVCKQSAWGDAINGGGTQIIKIEYRLGDDGKTPVGHTARCQNPKCRTLWEGYDAVMELADELKEKETVNAS